MTPGDRLSADVLRMENATTWNELEAVCRAADRFYDCLAADDDIRRAYENLKRAHALRVASTLAA